MVCGAGMPAHGFPVGDEAGTGGGVKLSWVIAIVATWAFAIAANVVYLRWVKS